MKPACFQVEHPPSGKAQEPYVLPQGMSEFPHVSMGELRQEFIKLVKRPIDFDQQINKDYQVRVLHSFHCSHLLNCHAGQRVQVVLPGLQELSPHSQKSSTLFSNPY